MLVNIKLNNLTTLIVEMSLRALLYKSYMTFNVLDQWAYLGELLPNAALHQATVS